MKKGVRMILVTVPERLEQFQFVKMDIEVATDHVHIGNTGDTCQQGYQLPGDSGGGLFQMTGKWKARQGQVAERFFFRPFEQGKYVRIPFRYAP